VHPLVWTEGGFTDPPDNDAAADDEFSLNLKFAVKSSEISGSALELVPFPSTSVNELAVTLIDGGFTGHFDLGTAVLDDATENGSLTASDAAYVLQYVLE
jgi:hypothetical protein